MKNILAFIGFLVVLGGVGYWYLTKPVATPSESVQINSTLTADDGVLYTIDQEQSTVSFAIEEVLRDKPLTAIGTTKNIIGDIAFNGKQLTFGTVSVNARTFITDDTRRDGAIARLILKSEKPENEFITFVPTGINRAPKTIAKNQPASFELIGDLTISGVTKPITLPLTVTVTDQTISGTIKGVIAREDFGITIPSIPFVASVEDVITIPGTVVAKRAQ